MQRRLSLSLLAKRGFSTSSSRDKIVASVLFERLPVVVPKIDPVVYAFQEFSGKGEYQIDFTPAPRITEDRKSRKSLQRALDRKLYLLIYGATVSGGNPVWHFPEKAYESEESLRRCAESALESVIGDLSHTYFVGNAPMGHMVTQPGENNKGVSSLKRFFFKSQVIAANKFDVSKCVDFVWVTKDELLEYFPQQAEFLNKMITS
nr:39S ribosomal protein L46, mitochondrial [Ipomoea batatas]